MVYGTGWIKAPVIFSRNDGNLTHMEVLLGLGSIQSLLGGTIQGAFKVVVNDVEIPQAVAGQDMTTTGWYNIVSTGAIARSFRSRFHRRKQSAAGRPVWKHGRYRNRCAQQNQYRAKRTDGRSAFTRPVTRRIQCRWHFAVDYLFSQSRLGHSRYSPAVRLEPFDVNMATFASAASFCDTLISTTDLNGNPLMVPRFQCNLILMKRQSAAEIIRGIRVASSLMIRFGVNGLLELLPETTLANQQPTLPDGGNSTASLNGGWPAYEFSDGSGTFSESRGLKRCFEHHPDFEKHRGNLQPPQSGVPGRIERVSTGFSYRWSTQTTWR